MTSIGNPKEFAAGMIFLAIGLGTLVEVRSYVIGTATQMGPGYFPMVLGILLVLIGLLAAWRGLRSAKQLAGETWHVLPLVFTTLGVLSFSYLITRSGLIVSIVTLVVFICYERLLTHPVEVVAICAILAAMSAGLFVYGIRLPIALW